VSRLWCKKFYAKNYQRNWQNINETSVTRCGPSFETKNYWRFIMLKFLGSTIGIIFLIGLVVVIALFKLVF